MENATARTLSVGGLLDEPLRSLLSPVEPFMEKLFGIDRCRELFETARRTGPGDPAGAVRRLLELLAVDYRVAEHELERIPRSGPLIVTANHPFGLLDGAILAAILTDVRSDVRIFTNSMLEGFPELHSICIFVDPFGETSTVTGNAGALRQGLAWLRRGGVLATFPAGEVAHLNFRDGTTVDPPWNMAIARLARISGSAALPVFFQGSNSMVFQLAGAVHPRLRTSSLPRELLNKSGRQIRVRIGHPIPSGDLAAAPSDRDAIESLRWRTYLLDDSEPVKSFPPRLPSFRRPADIVCAAPQNQLGAEIGRLSADSKLCEAGDFTVYIATAAEIPGILREIGRLREIAFRQAGEGTGRAIDLDRFDNHYRHLFAWNHVSGEVVGAYRLGITSEILPKYGVGGLYTSTLFQYRPSLFARLGPALELGRSFVRPEYQKQYAPLLLLWRGIGQFVARRPECATLFGGVSISARYHAVSRYLLVRYLETRRPSDLAEMVAPRRPYRPDHRAVRNAGTMPLPDDVDDLSKLIADLESDGKGVPILVKQYLKTGGRLLACNVDRHFADALDALIVVDLRNAPAPLLEKYLGKPGYQAFASWHRSSRGAA
jgi:putative hemolysin